MISIGRIQSKWRFYRSTITVCFFLNVLCIMTGMCLAVDHWNSALKLKAAQEQLFTKLEASDRIQVAIKNLQGDTKRDDTFEFENWSEIKIQLREIGAEAFPLEAFGKTDLRKAYLSRLDEQMRNSRQMWMNEWREKSARDSHVVRLILIISALALLFGLVLPLYCFSRITRLMVKMKTDLHKTAQNVVSEWLKSAHRFGEKPFRRFEFWLNIALLAAAYWGESSRHPSAQFAGELARLVKTELKKHGVIFDDDGPSRNA